MTHLGPSLPTVLPSPLCSNVLLSKSLRASLSDFETAQVVAASTCTVKGYSLLYAAPEQLMGQRCSLAADMYSFGVVMVELTTGQLLRTRGEKLLPQAPRDCPQVHRSRGAVACAPALAPTPVLHLSCC